MVLPVHNGMPYLQSSIESLLAQTYRDIEILVIDDGSSDGSSGYLQNLKDSRVRIITHDSCEGIVAALNRGLSEAQGEFIARQDADDLSGPERIERQVHFMNANPDIGVVATCAEFIDDSGLSIENAWSQEVRRLHDPATSPEALRELLPLTCCLVHGSILMRKTMLREEGGYRADFEWAEDYDLWLRLVAKYRFAKLPERLYHYRVHDSQVSAHRRRQQVRNTIRAKLAYLRRTRPELPFPARVVIQGNGFGAELYREVLGEFGLDEVAGPFDDPCCCDLAVITDFSLLEGNRGNLFPQPGWIREGNFFCLKHSTTASHGNRRSTWRSSGRFVDGREIS